MNGIKAFERRVSEEGGDFITLQQRATGGGAKKSSQGRQTCTEVTTRRGKDSSLVSPWMGGSKKYAKGEELKKKSRLYLWSRQEGRPG